MEDERRIGICPVCKKREWLYSIIGTYHGELWAGWMCNKCFAEIRDKRKERSEEE